MQVDIGHPGYSFTHQQHTSESMNEKLIQAVDWDTQAKFCENYKKSQATQEVLHIKWNEMHVSSKSDDA